MKLQWHFEFGPASQDPFSFCQIQLALETVYEYILIIYYITSVWLRLIMCRTSPVCMMLMIIMIIMLMMPDYWAVPNHQHASDRLLVSSFINNSINPHTWGEKGATVPIAFHIPASTTNVCDGILDIGKMSISHKG
jgi:hypothetical protein